MEYRNQKEIIIEEKNIVSVCIYFDKNIYGQASLTLDTGKSSVFAFSNGIDEGYVEYDYETKTIKTNGNIQTYIVVL